MGVRGQFDYKETHESFEQGEGVAFESSEVVSSLSLFGSWQEVSRRCLFCFLKSDWEHVLRMLQLA